MSFSSPIGLLALLAIPALIWLTMVSRARAKRYAVRFPAVSTLVAAAGTAPAWRRHVPTALACAALTALAFALARPHTTVAIPIERASIVLVTDHSRSMDATDVDPSRLAAAQAAARRFLGEVPKQVQVGAVAYSDSADAVQAPTSHHDDAKRIIDGQVADGATATGDALQTAIELLREQKVHGHRPPSAIVLLSDGKTTTGSDPVAAARQAAALHIPINTIALGTPGGQLENPDPFGPPLSVPPDPQTLAQIAEISGGQAFTAGDASKLSSIYHALGSRIGTRHTTREITAGFAAVGLVLLLGAGLASVRLSGRLP